jgi:hypothetical protein
MNTELYKKWSQDVQNKIVDDQRSKAALLELADGIREAFREAVQFHGVIKTGTVSSYGEFSEGAFDVDADLTMAFAVKVIFNDRNHKEIIAPVVHFVAKKDGKDFKVACAGSEDWRLVPYHDRKNTLGLKSVVDLLDAPLAAEVKKFVGG